MTEAQRKKWLSEGGLFDGKLALAMKFEPASDRDMCKRVFKEMREKTNKFKREAEIKNDI